MDKELKKPTLKDPKFFREPYDYRDVEGAGEYRGVGEAGKVGSKMSTSIDAMPPEKMKMMVARGWKKAD